MLGNNPSLLNPGEAHYNLPLHWAIEAKQTPVVEWLLTFAQSQNFDLVNIKNREGHSPLHCAARSNQLEMAKLLCQFGAFLHAEDKSRRTPIQLAKYHGHIEMVAFLRKEFQSKLIRLFWLEQFQFKWKPGFKLLHHQIQGPHEDCNVRM